VAVQPLELGDVERGWVAGDPLEREPLDQLPHREDGRPVVEGPTKQRQIVQERLRQEPLVSVSRDRYIAPPLRQRTTVGRHEKGQVREYGPLGRAESLADHDLARRRRHQILAPDDVRDPHQQVVHSDGQLVRRTSVRTQDDEVLDLLKLSRDRAAHHVFEGDRAYFGHLEAHHRGPAGRFVGRDLLGRKVPAGTGIAGRALLGLGLLAGRVELLRGAVAAVRVSRVEELVSMLDVEVEALALTVGTVGSSDLGALIPVEAQPAKVLQHGAEVLVGRPLRIRIGDA
jgi:hypothetical protein